MFCLRFTSQLLFFFFFTILDTKVAQFKINQHSCLNLIAWLYPLLMFKFMYYPFTDSVLSITANFYYFFKFQN